MSSHKLINCIKKFQKEGLKCTICVDSNIGGGKSTLLELLSKKEELKPFIELLFEPVERWQDINGNNLLNLFSIKNSFNNWNAFIKNVNHTHKCLLGVVLFTQNKILTFCLKVSQDDSGVKWKYLNHPLVSNQLLIGFRKFAFSFVLSEYKVIG